MTQTMLMEFDENTAIVHLNKEHDTPQKRDHIKEVCKRYGCDVIFKKEGEK